jgi:hypothetical protein
MSALLNYIIYFDNCETLLDESQRILLVGQLCSICDRYDNMVAFVLESLNLVYLGMTKRLIKM